MTDLLRIQELGQRLVTPVLPGLISEGAMVMTPTGAILIEDLSEGDRVLTYDRGAAVLEGFLHVTVCANGGRDVPIEINPYGKGSVCVCRRIRYCLQTRRIVRRFSVLPEHWSAQRL